MRAGGAWGLIAAGQGGPRGGGGAAEGLGYRTGWAGKGIGVGMTADECGHGVGRRGRRTQPLGGAAATEPGNGDERLSGAARCGAACCERLPGVA